MKLLYSFLALTRVRHSFEELTANASILRLHTACEWATVRAHLAHIERSLLNYAS